MNEDSVIKEIGRSYIVSSFLPSALFFAVLLLLFGGFIPTSLWNKIQDDNRLLAGTWLIGSIFTVWLAFFLFSSVDWIIKFFEGYYLPTWLYRKLVSVQKRRINRKIKTYNIARNLKADPSKSNDYQRFFNSIWYDAMGDIQDLELQAPLEEQNVMPTRLGNVFKASELYAYDRYFIEAITVWPRLFAILPSQFVKDMEEKTNHFMFYLILLF